VGGRIEPEWPSYGFVLLATPNVCPFPIFFNRRANDSNPNDIIFILYFYETKFIFIFDTTLKELEKNRRVKKTAMKKWTEL
jgi:hypothetical protein